MRSVSDSSAGASEPAIDVVLTPTVAITSPAFDLTTYISNYTGATKLNRLLFIAEICTSHQEEAYRHLVSSLKHEGAVNTKLYTQLKTICDNLGAGFEFDEAWVEDTDKKQTQRLDRLESELNGSKSKMIKESIRLSYTDLGDFHSNRGNYAEAAKNYMRTRDYCTTNRHMLEMGINTIRSYVDGKDAHNATIHVRKAEQLGIEDEKLRRFGGIVYLINADYKSAAENFVSSSSSLPPLPGSQIDPSDVASRADITTFAVICALATFDRAQLCKRIIENVEFKSSLEFTPLVRNLAVDFYSGQYSRLLASLDDLYPLLQIDIHMSSHAATLYELIKERCVSQYFDPYSSADLTRMSEVMQIPLSNLELLLVKMISSGKIPAIIDSETKTLYRHKNNESQKTLERVALLGKTQLRDLKGILLRLSFLKHHFSLDIENDASHLISSLTRTSSTGLNEEEEMDVEVEEHLP